MESYKLEPEFDAGEVHHKSRKIFDAGENEALLISATGHRQDIRFCICNEGAGIQTSSVPCAPQSDSRSGEKLV